MAPCFMLCGYAWLWEGGELVTVCFGSNCTWTCIAGRGHADTSQARATLFRWSCIDREIHNPSPKPIWQHPPSARRPFAQSDFSESDARNEVLGVHAAELQVEQDRTSESDDSVECRKLIWRFMSPEARDVGEQQRECFFSILRCSFEHRQPTAHAADPDKASSSGTGSTEVAAGVMMIILCLIVRFHARSPKKMRQKC